MTALTAYCPEARLIVEDVWKYDSLSNAERDTLIAAALIREIKRRGEWEAFIFFAARESSEDKKTIVITDFTAWLTTPETLIRVVGEWVGREDK